MPNGNCAACGHGRVFHRTNTFQPEPCSKFVEAGGLAGDCGCRAAFEVEESRGALARIAGTLAGWANGKPPLRLAGIEHDRTDKAGPRWLVTLMAVGVVEADDRVVGSGFTLAEAFETAFTAWENHVKAQGLDG